MDYDSIGTTYEVVFIPSLMLLIMARSATESKAKYSSPVGKKKKQNNQMRADRNGLSFTYDRWFDDNEVPVENVKNRIPPILHDQSQSEWINEKVTLI